MEAERWVKTSESDLPGGAVVTLTVTNPTKMNSLSTPVANAIIASVDAISNMPKLRCVIVTGGECVSGRAFIGGADIKEMSTMQSSAAGRRYITTLHRVCHALRHLSVPVIARVNGHALGAGLLVMMAADMKIAVSDALFGMPEVQRGVPSTIESALLPSTIGAGRASRLLLLGDTISAFEAERWGLVDKVVEHAQLDSAVSDWVTLVTQAGPCALAGQKRLLRVWEQVSPREAIDAGAWEFGKAFEGLGDQSEGRRMMNEFLSNNKKRKNKL